MFFTINVLNGLHYVISFPVLQSGSCLAVTYSERSSIEYFGNYISQEENNYSQQLGLKRNNPKKIINSMFEFNKFAIQTHAINKLKF